MYIPAYAKNEDQNLIEDVIKNYPLALCVSANNGNITANHFPMIKTQDKLIGHMAKNNPQWKEFEEDGKALVIFSGPHTYISPSIYVNPNNVPTWNYVAIHCHVTLKVRHEPRTKEEILKHSIKFFEQENNTRWEMQLPTDYKEKLLAGIVGFEGRIEKVEAKFKLNQKSEKNDYQAVQEYFARQADLNSVALYKYMKATQP